MNNHIQVLLLAINCMITCNLIFGQVTPYINSGNPKYPFPQFLEYTNKDATLGNLGTQNSPGVPHAEMELRISEAYRNICNNLSTTNENVAGVDYIRPTPQGGDPCTCAEADGYYLQAIAYMGDKVTFDGYYMQMHDRAIHRTKRFIDGGINSPDYPYSTRGNGAGNKTAPFATNGSTAGNGNNIATDGDVDIALALLIAYKQWGENSGIILNGNGFTNFEINYKDEARLFIGSLADTLLSTNKNPEDQVYNTGVIGLDGYFKDGDSQAESTDWFPNDGTPYRGIPYIEYPGEKGSGYVDYYAPAWMEQFALWFEDEGYSQWNIDQYRRARASSNWIMGRHYDQDPRHIPVGGDVEFTNPTFTEIEIHDGNDAEDARHPWRHLMDYVWNGNQEMTWNPTTHEIDIAGVDQSEYLMGLRYADFLKEPQSAPWNAPCEALGGIDFGGPPSLRGGYNIDGSNPSFFYINWLAGSSAPALVIAQDYETMGAMYRKCEIEWDAGNSGDYLTGDPAYFHEWFRYLGMMIYSGNYQPPMQMNPSSNLKVYRSVDKTFVFTGDVLYDTITYRNYGTVAANDVTVELNIQNSAYEIISAQSLDGSPLPVSTTFNIGTVEGFSSDNLEDTKGGFIVEYRINENASGRYCPTASIYENGTFHWESNEYPNHVTPVMERNCFDVIKRSLEITKTASGKTFNPGDEVEFELCFKNSSEAGWLNGGRPGVTASYARGEVVDPTSANQVTFFMRLWHDAEEAYIDYSNYRFSYFVNEPSVDCAKNDVCAGTGGCTGAGGTCDDGWDIRVNFPIAINGDVIDLKLCREDIIPGPTWDQRIVVSFGEKLATTTPHLYNYFGMPKRIHRGSVLPLDVEFQLFTSNNANLDWTNDFSWNENALGNARGFYHPITPNWTDPNDLGTPVDTWHRQMCPKPDTIVDNILVEEWDGYVWRRIYGNGPAPGRDILDVVVKDTLPLGMTFNGFIDDEALGEIATTSTLADGRIEISWSKACLLVDEEGCITYSAIVDFPSENSCQTPDEDIINDAWISASTESPFSGSDTITITCLPQVKCPNQVNLQLDSDKLIYDVNETILYQLDYIQDIGTIVNNPEDTRWQPINGLQGGLSVNAGIINLNTNNQQRGSTYEYSHGTDGTIEGEFTLMQDRRDYGIVFRENAGNYSIVKFEKTGAGVNIIIDNEDGTRLGNTSVSGIAATFDFKIELEGGTVRVWVGDTAFPFANIEVTGATVSAGYAGVFATPGEPSSLTNWRTHLDSAFDLELNAPTANGVTNPTNISDGGNLSNDTVIWTITPSGPILSGTTFTRTWEATIDSCGDLTHITYVHALGIEKNTYGDCHETECGTVPTCLLPTLPDRDTITYCEGDEVDLSTLDYPDPAGNATSFTIFNGDWTNISSSMDFAVAKDSIIYLVAENTTSDCADTLNLLMDVVNVFPTTLTPDQSQKCDGEEFDLIITGPPNGTITLDIGGTIYVIELDASGEPESLDSNSLPTSLVPITLPSTGSNDVIITEIDNGEGCIWNTCN